MAEANDFRFERSSVQRARQPEDLYNMLAVAFGQQHMSGDVVSPDNFYRSKDV
jgi:hypothetical protein